MKSLLICLLVSGFLFLPPSPIHAQDYQNTFQKGILQEEGEGNLSNAIEIYNSLVNDTNVERSIRAKSLLHVGICYEKLGNQNARTTYQKLISEYADQKDIVAIGKVKLNGLKKLGPIPINKGIVTTQVWSKAEDTQAISPDGRYLSYIDWGNISTNIKDLYTGKTKALTNTGTWKGTYKYPDKSIFSPDSKKVAYTWYNGPTSELHIVNVDGSSNMILAKGENFSAPWAVAWSPDGKYILAIMETHNEEEITLSRKLVLVSVNDGSIKVLKSFNLPLGGQMDISPDNKYVVYSQQQKENSHEKDIYIISMDGRMDKKIVDDIADDTTPFWTPDGKEILFVSDRYGNKDLWKLKVEDGNPIGAAELVKVNLGSIYLLGITNDKSVYFESSNKRSDIYIANLNSNLGKDKFQEDKISKLSKKNNIKPFWSNDGRYLGYLNWPKFRNELGFQYLITIYDTKTKKSRDIATEIYGNPRMSQAQWLPDGKTILFYGISKNNLKHDFFLLDINTGKYSTIHKSNKSQKKFGSYNHPVISHDGKSIFYLSFDYKSISKIDIDSKKETIVFKVKDVISQFNLSNDDSKIAFRYRFENKKELYIVSTSGGEKRRILRSTGDTSIYLNSWSEDDKYLYYNEGEWTNIKKIMRISIDGGDPEEVLEFKNMFENGNVHKANITPDGQHIAIGLQVGMENEIWKIEGVFDE